MKLDLPETRNEILKYSPSAKVPALLTDGIVIWDSLAIMEYVNEKFPEKQMYPQDALKRALARSMVSEMHSGFQKLREHMRFHAKKRFHDFDATPASGDIGRILQIWHQSLKDSSGPYLMGHFSIVDAMYAPVVCRFQTYGIKTEGAIRNYCERILDLPALRDWYAGAMAENFVAIDHE